MQDGLPFRTWKNIDYGLFSIRLTQNTDPFFEGSAFAFHGLTPLGSGAQTNIFCGPVFVDPTRIDGGLWNEVSDGFNTIDAFVFDGKIHAVISGTPSLHMHLNASERGFGIASSLSHRSK